MPDSDAHGYPPLAHDGAEVRGATLQGRSGDTLGLRPYAMTLIAVAAALGAAWVLRPVAGLENVDLVFLTAIIAVAARYGLWPSLASCLASVLAYNFFFIPPL